MCHCRSSRGGGNTPLAVAIDQQHKSCVELLQAHLAREIEVHDASRQGDQADLAREIEVVAFSGQGIPSGQLAELRRVSKLEPVHAFLSMLSQCFAKELEAMPAAATAHTLPMALTLQSGQRPALQTAPRSPT